MAICLACGAIMNGEDALSHKCQGEPPKGKEKKAAYIESDVGL